MSDMNQYFPPDVRVKTEGDPALAREMLGKARDTLFKALQMRETGGASHTRVVAPQDDGSVIVATLAGTIKTIYIYAVPQTPPPPEELEEPREETPVTVDIAANLLHGWVDIKTQTALSMSDYKPTQLTARLNSLSTARQSSARLTGVHYATIHASMFSGAMKRVAQAIMGLGSISDNSKLYITGLRPTVIKRKIDLLYEYSWASTHSVVRASAKCFWLVEVSQTRGVLAMPLPLFGNTTTPAYRARLVAKGDIETLRVVDEFGGLPSGEVIPATGPTLEALILSGKILRLLTADDLAPFYTKKMAYGATLGWAFSDTGVVAHNTCAAFRGPFNALRDVGEVITANTGGSTATRSKSYLTGEHWSLTFTLSSYSLRDMALARPLALGGTAVLAMVSAGRMDIAAAYNIWAPSGGDGNVSTNSQLYNGLDLHLWGYTARLTQQASTAGWGATVHVFFNGDQLERVRWVEGQGETGARHDSTGNLVIYGAGVYHESPITVVHPLPPHVTLTIDLGNRDEGSEPATWTIPTDQTIAAENWNAISSPFGFVATSIDPRNRHDWSGDGRQASNSAHFGGSTYPSRVNETVAILGGLFESFYRPGVQFFAKGGPTANDPHFINHISLLIPNGCREAYVMHIDGPSLTMDYQNYWTRQFYRATTAFISGQVVTMPPMYSYVNPVAGVGGIPYTLSKLIGGSAAPPEMYCSAVMSGGYQQSYIIGSYRYDAPVKTLVHYNMPSSFSAVRPEKMNWIGSP